MTLRVPPGQGRSRSLVHLTDAELATHIRAPESGKGRRRAGLPQRPAHLTGPAAAEWRRVARLLYDMGVLTSIDRAALAAYCQAYGRWVEAEERLRETPMLFKTPSGYVQQSPWLGIVNKQLELMGRYMTELGMTPASRSRVSVGGAAATTRAVSTEPLTIEIVRFADQKIQKEDAGSTAVESWLKKHGGTEE